MPVMCTATSCKATRSASIRAERLGWAIPARAWNSLTHPVTRSADPWVARKCNFRKRRGVVISGSASTGTVVAGNLIGTDVSGTAAIGNSTAGIIVAQGSGTTIGGTAVLARNVISGNAGDGILVQSAATSTLIQGNYIGLDQTGTRSLGNQGSGVSDNDAPSVMIGGEGGGASNVISANAQSGVSIQGTDATGVAVLGNFIGTDSSASSAQGNSLFGVLLSGTTGVVVGGLAPAIATSSRVTAPRESGFWTEPLARLIAANMIGTGSLVASALGNETGILISGSSAANTIGGSVGAGNTVAFSTGSGVELDSTAGAMNVIRLNSIFANAGPGIDLGDDGVTLNDSVPHTGPNLHQNFPVITAVTSAGGTTTVTGTLASVPNSTFAIDFYTLAAKNDSGYGEGRYVLGSGSLAVGVSGTAGFSFAFATPATGAQFVTATATDPAGNTSEFSRDFGGNQPPVASIGFTTRTVDEGVAVSFDGSGSVDPDGNLLTYAWSFGDGATATGATTSHVFDHIGTDTVMLTISDGFGGTSTATATVNVADVPPVFAQFVPAAGAVRGTLERRRIRRCGRDSRRQCRDRGSKRQRNLGHEPCRCGVPLRRRTDGRWHRHVEGVRLTHPRFCRPERGSGR